MLIKPFNHINIGCLSDSPLGMVLLLITQRGLLDLGHV